MNNKNINLNINTNSNTNILNCLENLKKHKPSIIDLNQCHQSAVCIPLIQTKTGYDILFEVRSPKILHQPGDICFPGGMIEEGETNLHAAVRETCEELCVLPKQIEVLGQMDIFFGGSIVVYPYTILLKDYKNTFSEEEVKEVFSVPLDFFLQNEPEIYPVERPAVLPDNFPYDKIVGGKNYKWRKRLENIYFYQYHNYTIWGMTAKILYSFITLWREFLI